MGGFVLGRRGRSSFKHGRRGGKIARKTFSVKLHLEPLEDRRLLSIFYSAVLDTNPGWSVSGQWAFGQPTGQGGVAHPNPDPSSGYTGSNVYGVNLNGDYSTTAGGP